MFLLVGLAGAGGCASDANTGTVSGEVTLDGVPLKEGIVRFVPVDGQSQPADAIIKNGQFQATVAPGEKRVEISAPKVIGQQKMYNTPEAPVVDDVAELIPERYNVRSELTMTVQRGSQEKRFALKGTDKGKGQSK